MFFVFLFAGDGSVTGASVVESIGAGVMSSDSFLDAVTHASIEVSLCMLWFLLCVREYCMRVAWLWRALVRV